MTLLRSLLCAAAGTTLVSAVAFAQALGAAPTPMSPDTVLADNGVAKVTRADYDYELTRLPENVRGGFATTDKRVADLINRMLVTKTLAAQADAQKLMEQPEVARRLALEIEKLKAQLMVAKLEADAAARFDANPAPFEARARDLYAINPRKWDVAGEVSASHILFATPPHSVEEARKLAAAARAEIVAGADFEAIARARSEDPSAKQNGGKLGFFKRGQMDGSFENAAFALTKVGEVSEPVETAYGFHLIRLDGRKDTQRMTFEQAKPRIMAEQRAAYIASQRDEVVEQIKVDAYKATDMGKVGSMVIRADAAQLDRLQRESLQRQQEALREAARQKAK